MNSSSPESTALVKAVLDLPGLNFRAVVQDNTGNPPSMLIETLFSVVNSMRHCSPDTLPQSWALIREAFRKHLMQRLLAVKESVSGIDINVAHIVTQYELNPLEYASYAYCKSQEETAKAKAAAQNSTTAVNTASTSSQTAHASKVVSEVAVRIVTGHDITTGPVIGKIISELPDVSFIPAHTTGSSSTTTTLSTSSSAVSMVVASPASSSPSSADLASCTNYPETKALKFVREIMQSITELSGKKLLDSLQPETVAPTSTCTNSSSGSSLTFSAQACAVAVAAAAAVDPSRTTTSSSVAVSTANANLNSTANALR